MTHTICNKPVSIGLSHFWCPAVLSWSLPSCFYQISLWPLTWQAVVSYCFMSSFLKGIIGTWEATGAIRGFTVGWEAGVHEKMFNLKWTWRDRTSKNIKTILKLNLTLSRPPLPFLLNLKASLLILQMRYSFFFNYNFLITETVFYGSGFCAFSRFFFKL